jgi:hypothetical protein
MANTSLLLRGRVLARMHGNAIQLTHNTLYLL